MGRTAGDVRAKRKKGLLLDAPILVQPADNAAGLTRLRAAYYPYTVCLQFIVCWRAAERPCLLQWARSGGCSLHLLTVANLCLSEF
jgi:hypothetical protein